MAARPKSKEVTKEGYSEAAMMGEPSLSWQDQNQARTI
jgi:hypothetical protein